MVLQLATVVPAPLGDQAGLGDCTASMLLLGRLPVCLIA